MENGKNNLRQMMVSAQPEDLLQLALAIVEKHKQEGPNSVLKTNVIANLHYKTMMAKEKHDEAMKYARMMEDAMKERNCIIGSPSMESTIAGILHGLVPDLQNLDKIDLH